MDSANIENIFNLTVTQSVFTLSTLDLMSGLRHR